MEKLCRVLLIIVASFRAVGLRLDLFSGRRSIVLRIRTSTSEGYICQS